MSLETLQKLCRILHVSSDYILLGENNPEISRKNLYMLIDSIEPKYYSIIEQQIYCFINSVKEIERRLLEEIASDIDNKTT